MMSSNIQSNCFRAWNFFQDVLVSIGIEYIISGGICQNFPSLTRLEALDWLASVMTNASSTIPVRSFMFFARFQECPSSPKFLRRIFRSQSSDRQDSPSSLLSLLSPPHLPACVFPDTSFLFSSTSSLPTSAMVPDITKVCIKEPRPVFLG